MPFSISQMIVDADEQVVALDWVYKNQDGQLSNQHALRKPYGDKPLTEVTTPVALEWLKEQLGNTAEDFDAAIAQYKQQQEYSEGLRVYTTNLRSAPTKVEPEEVGTMPAESDELQNVPTDA